MSDNDNAGSERTIPVELPPEHEAALKNPPTFTDEQLIYLEAILAAECCHTTGMHDPTHWQENGTVCWQSMHKPYKRAIEKLGIKVPIYSAHDCGTCRSGYAEGSESPYTVDFPTFDPKNGVIGNTESDHEG